MKTKYLLDTNVLISMFKNKGMVRNHIKDVGFSNCVVSEISIAGVTALQNNYTMVTANMKHMERIPNLNIQNWE